MIALPETVMLPLRMGADGVIYLRNSRVTLDVVIGCWRRGDTPEDIHEGFPTLTLPDLYAAIAYYLANQTTVEAYLHQRDEAAARQRDEIEAHYTDEQRARTTEFRRLLAEKRQSGRN